ncbi:hypothetical protein LR48_Vigan661s001800 [Vigna angularis]|uniref:Uncharacterized protein n=1 Tax=Phaseolus angularis TaxID=3914 RepID=A0A0L9TFZ4_PHAAN|nr:hypothetical protein LR48_Vigan661s001800 [Vigna angularis]
MSSDFSDGDDDNASPSSSLAAFTGPDARASPSGNSSDLLVDSDAPDEVAIHMDSTGAWDGKPRAWPPVPGYDWVPHEVRQMPSSFYDRQAFRDLINHICLVKTAADVKHFKLAICQRTERVCHGFHSSTSCRDCGRSSSSLRVAPKKKGKRKAARETSAESKHAKRSLPDGPPLPSLLNPNSWVAKRLHFDLFAEEKALVSGMTEEEASNMALELTARSTMCQTYAAQKKTSISAELQALQAKFDSTFKANQDLTLRLAETERMAEEDKKKASTLLAEVRATQRRMQRSLDDAKLDLQKATSSHTTLTTEWDSLLDRVTKLEAEVKLLGDEVVNEHVLRFDKALAQCNLLFQVLTDDPRLDVSMMVVDSKLVPINIPPSSPSVGQNVDPAVEVVGETGEAAGQS